LFTSSFLQTGVLLHKKISLVNEQKIKTIIDTNLQRWIDLKLNTLPVEIETEMTDQDQHKIEGWSFWYPIDSRVTDSEIEDFEKQVGHILPTGYKTFLKHKHFYELHISEVSFTSHPVNTWRAKQVEMIFEGYPAEYLIEKGYLPFANWSDWGLLCFDTNSNKEDNNYPVVLWDHEVADKFEAKYLDFFDLLIKIDAEEKQNTG
jgi:hypothetical protein